MIHSFVAERDRLHEQAAADTGCDRFGAPDYLQGLEVVLEGLDAGPELTPLGRSSSMGLVRDGLAGRLLTQRAWDVHPEYRDVAIKAPIFIMGLPRSGTTALHKLVSLDPQFQGFERWLLGNPKPRPPRAEWAGDPDYVRTVSALQARYAAAPAAQKAHPVVADEPDECLRPMSQSFISNWWGSNLEAAGYDEWFFGQDETESYRRYADILKLVGMNAPNQRWLLKNPSHIMGIDALLAAFPDACLIHTVRHPVETIASLTALMANIRGPLMGHRIDSHALARRQIRWYAEAVRRTMAASDRQPGRVFEVDFRDFLVKPMTVVGQIYTRFGLDLAPETDARMRQWLADNPQGKHGPPTYSLNDFGLTDVDVDAAFEGYISRYQLGA